MKPMPLKILMLEDSDADAEMIQHQLKKTEFDCEFKVMMTKSAYELALHEYKPDIILSDNAMPQFSASEALEILLQQNLDIPFILVTGTVSEEFAAGIIKAGADDYLLKDRLTRLPVAIEAALKQKQTEKEKREAAKQLKQSEERYHTLTHVAPVGIFHTNAEGYTTYVNPKWSQISGLSFEEAIGDGWLNAVHREDKERLIKGWQNATGDQQFSTSEYRFVHADGAVAWVLGQATPEKNAAGEVVGYVGTITDITVIKNAEAAIKKSNERFELIAKATNDGLWDWNLETNQVWGNEVHQQLYGLTIADPAPDHEEWKRRIHPEDRERTLMALEDAKSSGQYSYVDEYRFQTENAGWMNIYGRTLIQRNKEGKPIRLIGSMMDITERKNAEELLAASEKRFRKLLENGNDAFAILSPEGRAIYVSSSAERLLGYTEEEIYQLDMFSLVHPDNIAEVQQTMKTVMETPGIPFTGHLSRLKHKDGTWHWYEDTITNLMDDPDIRGIVDNFTDVTERINHQLALAESEDKHRNIVENITDILCTHDLNGKVLSVNRTAKKYLGYEVEEMVQMNIQDILLPNSKERFGEYINSIKKNGFAQGLMYVQTRTGENRVWEFRNSLRTAGVATPFVYGFAQDVTERIKAEEIVKDKNAQLQTLSDNLPGVIIYQLIAEPDGTRKFTYVSNGVIPITGKKPEEIIANPSILYNVIVKEDLPVLLAKENESLRKMEMFSVELRCLTYKGEVRWLNIISTPRRLDNGQIVWDGFHLDITERKRAEEAITGSEEKYRTLVEQASDGIFIADNSGKFIMVNGSGCKMSGYTTEELAAMTIYELVHGDSLKSEPFNFEAMMQPQGARSERKMVCKDGAVVDIEISAKFLSDKRFIAFIRDISERIKAQEEIKQTSGKLRELTAHLLNIREEERKRIGREIHDELGQQLTAIKMDVSWIDKKTPDETTLIKNKLKNIITLLDGSNQSIRRILSELRPGILDDYGLVEALEWQNRQFTSHSGIPVDFVTTERELKLPEPVATCIFRVYQEAFTNITRHAFATKVVASVLVKSGNIIVTLEDNGKGFEPKTVEGKKSFGILGMKERVIAQGGNFELLSEVSRGTKIIIRLPYIKNKKSLN